MSRAARITNAGIGMLKRRAGAILVAVSAAAAAFAVSRGWPEAAIAWAVAILALAAVVAAGALRADRAVGPSEALAAQLDRARSDGAFVTPMAAVVVELRGVAADTIVDGSAAWSQPIDVIARRLLAADLGADLSIARLGPHTFGAAFACPDPAAATAAGESLVALCRVPVPIGDRDVQVDAVAGVRHAPVGHRSSGEEMVREADAALRIDNGAASPVAAVDERLVKHARRVIEVETEIRHSLDVDLLTARLLPVVDVRRDGLVGLRSAYDWTSVSKAEPETLKSIAGSLGLRRSIETQYLMRSMIAADSIPDASARRVVATIEPTRLNDPRAVGQIGLLLDVCGLEPSSLVLEFDGWGAANLGPSSLAALDEIGVGIGLSLRHRGEWERIPGELVDRCVTISVVASDLVDVDEGRLIEERAEHLRRVTVDELERVTVLDVDHAPIALELSSAGLVRQCGLVHGREMTAPDLRKWLLRRAIG